jgi:hypothetical protein
MSTRSSEVSSHKPPTCVRFRGKPKGKVAVVECPSLIQTPPAPAAPELPSRSLSRAVSTGLSVPTAKPSSARLKATPDGPECRAVSLDSMWRSGASGSGARRLDEHPEKMRQRRETVEHPFGTIKARMGATHFLMKTLPQVDGSACSRLESDPRDEHRRHPALIAAIQA